jgi:hypothetical protein
MTDEPKWLRYSDRILEPTPTPGELLFEFVRASDHVPMTCELRFHGESWGWEAEIRERGELFVIRGAFTTREAAIRWADEMRKAMESETRMEPLPPGCRTSSRLLPPGNTSRRGPSMKSVARCRGLRGRAACREGGAARCRCSRSRLESAGSRSTRRATRGAATGACAPARRRAYASPKWRRR